MVVVISLGSALLYAVASVLQQRAAVDVPAHVSMRVGLLVQLLRRPLWLAGVAADCCGYGLQFAALDRGSLVLVQPLLVTGLLFALPLGAALSRGRLRAGEWLGAAAVVAGLAVFLVVANPDQGRPSASNEAWGLLLLCTLVPTAVLVLGARGPQGARRAVLLAAAAGILYGLTAALTKTSAHLLEGGVAHALSAWQPYALVAAGALGMLVSQSAFQAGPLTASLPVLTVVDPVVSILIGALVFAEGIETAAGAIALEVLSMTVMIGGVLLLTRSPLVLHTDEDVAASPTHPVPVPPGHGETAGV